MTVDGETEAVQEGDAIYIESGKSHGLVNTGTEDMHMMFVYAPKMIAEHWAQETAGELILSLSGIIHLLWIFM